MNGKDSWKKTGEIEINLMDLLRRLSRQWKQILICALAASVIVGAYGFLQKKGSVEVSRQENEVRLTDEEMQTVQDAVYYAEKIKRLESYMEQSVLMQINPYHKNRVTMLYSIDGGSYRSLQKMMECYLNYLVNGGAVSAVRKKEPELWTADSRYLSELLSAWRITDDSRMLLSDADTQTDAVRLLYIELAGKDKKQAEKLADAVQDAVQEYVPKVKKICGSHSLSLLEKESTEGIDSGLQTMQQEKYASLNADRTALKALTDTFTQEQNQVFLQKSDSVRSENEEEAKPADAGDFFLKAMKYLLVGLIGGCFVYSGIYICLYLMTDTVRYAKEFQERYTIPFFGGMPVAMDHNLCKEAMQVLHRIRLICKRREIRKICIATDAGSGRQEQQCLENMVRKLQEWGIDVTFAGNILASPDVWDTVFEIRTVFAIYKAGKTTHHQIEEDMQFYMQNGMEVIGAAVWEGKI